MVITAMAMKRKMKMEVINSDKLLFSPGPLTTSATVKRAMLRDLGSLDSDFLASVRNVLIRATTTNASSCRAAARLSLSR
jgi:aspartate aminotransferase-like enzyme